MKLSNENAQLLFMIEQIKDIFTYKSDMALFPKFLCDLKTNNDKNNIKMNEKLMILEKKITDLET